MADLLILKFMRCQLLQRGTCIHRSRLYTTAEQVGQHCAAVQSRQQRGDILLVLKMLFHLQAQHDGGLLEGLCLGKMLLAQRQCSIELAGVFQLLDLVLPGDCVVGPGDHSCQRCRRYINRR